MAMPAPRRAPRRLPTILFDLDGTLLDSIQLILESARYAFDKLGRECPPDSEWLTGVGIPLAAAFNRYARDPADCAALIAAYREYQLPNHDRLIRGYDGSVARSSSDSIAAATTSASSRASRSALAMRGLARIGLARFMDTVVGCDCLNATQTRSRARTYRAATACL